VGTVDDFLADLPGDPRAALERVRALAEAVAPTAEQDTSYGMPALKYRGRPLLGFASAKAHLSVFPFDPAVIEAVSDRLAGFSLSKGTIRFTVDNPLPDDVITDVVQLRKAAIDDALG
jgi:uncharacterized protein YdhG (YjbR/CyaY superfamily)